MAAREELARPPGRYAEILELLPEGAVLEQRIVQLGDAGRRWRCLLRSGPLTRVSSWSGGPSSLLEREEQRI